MYVAPPPSVAALIGEFPRETLLDGLLLEPGGPMGEHFRDGYLHWDKLRHLDPPGNLNPREWWLRIKIGRLADTRLLPMTAIDGSEFAYCLPDSLLRHLHRIDRRLAGGIGFDAGGVFSDRQAARRFLVNARMEEAIRSSQLEGATTSRQVAREMLRSGRPPRDLGERMVTNNYLALGFMRNEIGDELTPEAVLALHAVITEGTLEDPAASGRLQQPGEERVAVFYRDEDEDPIHRPPPAELLPDRLQMLCDFANQSEDAGRFVPPVVRAILVHFWLAYDHPFVDGNGRTARILFFWVMRNRGYELAEYLPISRLLRAAPAQYTRAFLETETDEGDATYFILHQLRVIERAIEDLDVYLQGKRDELRDVRRILDDVEGLNGRQIVLLTHAIKHPDHVYTLGGHALSHRVTHETARADLGGLVGLGLLVRRRSGRSYEFRAVPDLPQRLKESNK
jgi:Fic family protein